MRNVCFIVFVLNFNFFFVSAQQPLTPRLIYDYAPGDLFHYHTSDYYNFTYQGGFSVKVLGKLVSQGNDSLTYYVQKNSYTQAMDQNTGQFTDTIFNYEVDTLIYTDLDTDIALLPQYNQATYQDYLNYYNYYASLDSSCLFGMNFSDTLNNWSLNGVQTPAYFSNYDVSPSFCNNYVSRTFNQAFGKGLGPISYYHSVSGGPFYGNSYGMVYFKKDTVESGTPDIFLSDVDEMEIPQIVLYPNPCNDLFYVDLTELPNLSYALKLFNVQGQLLDVINLQKTLVKSCDISNLSAGMYLYQLCHLGKILNQGKLMIER